MKRFRSLLSVSGKAEYLRGIRPVRLVARLYEQGADSKRVAHYLARWLGWALALSTGPGFCGFCPGVVTGSVWVTLGGGPVPAVYSDCEVVRSGTHAALHATPASLATDRFVGFGYYSPPGPNYFPPFLLPGPASGGPLPLLGPQSVSLVSRPDSDACADVQYPLQLPSSLVLVDGSYYCFVASDSGLDGGREQRISARWNGTSWVDVYMTDSLIPDRYDFNTDTAGGGSGNTTGSTPDGSYDSGTAITLVATADTRSTFTGWTPASCVDGFSLAADTTCTANFDRTLSNAQSIPTMSVWGLAALSGLLALFGALFSRRRG